MLEHLYRHTPPCDDTHTVPECEDWADDWQTSQPDELIHRPDR